jgi:hypothetical protein
VSRHDVQVVHVGAAQPASVISGNAASLSEEEVLSLAQHWWLS